MKPEEYMQNRVDDQINWYDSKSQRHQRWYKQLRFVEILAAASIPFLSGYIQPGYPAIKFSVGLLGVLIAVLASVTSLNRFQENWIEYRTTCESLKHEKFLFQTGVEPYTVDGPFSLFVQRIESLISKENTNWSHYIKPLQDEDGREQNR